MISSPKFFHLRRRSITYRHYIKQIQTLELAKKLCVPSCFPRNNNQKLGVTRNRQWSVVGLHDVANGNVVERYAYDMMGKRTIYAPDGTTVRTTSSYGNNFGYTSRWHDEESGLMYFRVRYFNPLTGEFLQRDPTEFLDGMSLYRAYMGFGYVDPLGLWLASGDDGDAWPWWEAVSTFGYEITVGSGGRIYGGVRSLATGEAGAVLGQRAVVIAENYNNGQQFEGSVSEYLTFSHAVVGEIVGTNAIAEAGIGHDIANQRALTTEERIERGAAGTAALSSTLAGGGALVSRFASNTLLGRAISGIGGKRIPGLGGLDKITQGVSGLAGLSAQHILKIKQIERMLDVLKRINNFEWLRKRRIPNIEHWEGLPLMSSNASATEAVAGSYVSRRIALTKQTPEGYYKFVVDADGNVWLAPVSESLKHSALVPPGSQVRGAGYAAVSNGRANVNGRSGHYMADNPLLGEQATLYDNAIRRTFANHGVSVIDNTVGLDGGRLCLPKN